MAKLTRKDFDEQIIQAMNPDETKLDRKIVKQRLMQIANITPKGQNG